LQFTNPITQETIDDDQSCATYRTDTGKKIGTVSPTYEIIQNEQLCQFAEMLRDDVEMETVVVLKGGAKIAFSAKILGTDASIVEGDIVHRRLNGYLSHDGTSSFGGMFSDIRIVCQNTLGYAMDDANKHGKQFKISHTKLGVSQIDATLRSIDVARQTFHKDIECYKLMAETPMDFNSYRTWLTSLYNMPSVKQDDGTLRSGSIEDSKIKWNKLRNAWAGGFGSAIPGVADTVWGAYNSITEVETSLREAPASRNIATVNGYYVRQIISKAKEQALELCTV
jgi:phage/plasmid-like protein (TIGR03299 family)